MWSEVLNFEVDNDEGNFVGLRREGGSLSFVMPKGCEDMQKRLRNQFASEDDEERRKGFEDLTKFFFNTYQTIQCFYAYNRGKKRCQLAGRGDALHAPEGAPKKQSQSLETDAGEMPPALFYSKLPWIEDIMSRKHELEYSTLAQMPRHTSEVDYNQIHQHLHRATFLDTDTDAPIAFLQDMEVPQNVVLYQATDLVRLLCFIYEEIADYLPDYEVTPRIAELSTEFRDRHLTDSASLFDYDSHRLTLLECREVLDKIERHTGYKSEEFYDFYDAAERFLYGANQDAEDGKEWGIENFSYVWEDLCHTWLLDNKHIKLADTDIRTHKQPKNYYPKIENLLMKTGHNSVGNVFQIRWGGDTNTKRILKPDCVYSVEIQYQPPQTPTYNVYWYILDLKYWSKGKISGPMKRDDLIKSIIKQQMYEGCLRSFLISQQKTNHNFAANAFVRPDVFDGGKEPIEPVNGRTIHGIADWHGDFNRLSENYLEFMRNHRRL